MSRAGDPVTPPGADTTAGPPTPGDLQRQAAAAARAGRYLDAVQGQVAVINALRAAQAGDDTLYQAHRRFAYYLYLLGDYGACAGVLRRMADEHPEDIEMRVNLGVALAALGDHPAAVRELAALLPRAPQDLNLHDTLARSHGALGNAEQSRAHGERSLILKDAAAMAGPPDTARVERIPTIAAPAPPFDPAAPAGSNVIAFSLWGTRAKYLDGAAANAEAARTLYPGWTCRFYCAPSVPGALRAHLRARGAQIIDRPEPAHPWDGLFWRFEVAEAPGVQRFLVRDADAVVNPREQAAVAAWLASGRPFHIMRDWYTHTELILAGLWGGVGGRLPIADLRRAFRVRAAPTMHLDQWFLRQTVWPLIRDHALTHDSHHRVLGAVPFPEGSELPPGRHVGENAFRVGAGTE